MSTAAVSPETIESRATPRFPVSIRGVLVEDAAIGEHVDVLNVARLGFLARSRLHRATGVAIRVYLPMLGPCEAHVVWNDKGLLGARFADAIDEEAFEAFLAAHRFG